MNTEQQIDAIKLWIADARYASECTPDSPLGQALDALEGQLTALISYGSFTFAHRQIHAIAKALGVSDEA